MVPPLLDAAAAYQILLTANARQVNNMTKASESNESQIRANTRLTECVCLASSPTRRSGLAMHQTGDFVFWDTALRRLRTSGGRTQPLDGFTRRHQR